MNLAQEAIAISLATLDTHNNAHTCRIAAELAIKPAQVAAVAELLDAGATVPFIARYRKEATGSLDEVAVAAIRDRLAELAALDKRRASILGSLAERELLTDDLRRAIDKAPDMTTLEDIYLPYRPKRRTRAALARERGLEPLADLLLAQRGVDPQKAAEAYVAPDKDLPDVDSALAGARDIMAERFSEDASLRNRLRDLFLRRGRFHSHGAKLKDKSKEEAAATYRDWFDWEEPLRNIPGHRALAMFRGEREGFLHLALRPPEDEGQAMVERAVVKAKTADSREVATAATDAYKRLIAPSLENETRAELKARADAEAIRVFASNLRALLLAPPLGPKRVLALDPGFRTGAKLAVLDGQGSLVHNETIFPTGSQHQQDQAAATLRSLCQRHAIEAVAVGNGTAGRETQRFVLALKLGIPAVLVNESGASIYSASETARREFPDLDLTVRGAVSIGRRLMDPLAELVKIEAKSIGVGQYQHDVDQAALKRALDDLVASCVNAVGVDLNCASPELLGYVSGLGPVLARNIVAYREANGPFDSRRALRKVPRLGPKAFEQAAGFLRVRGKNPLDASAVHPERYELVERMAADAGCALVALLADPAARARVHVEDYLSEEVGLPTLADIMAELAKPGRDPRAGFSAFAFSESVADIKDLAVGMRLPGIVTNVTKFGAFVDIGVHRDGLVHISQLADRYVSDPSQVVSVGHEVMATVVEIDLARGRIGLSLRT